LTSLAEIRQIFIGKWADSSKTYW